MIFNQEKAVCSRQLFFVLNPANFPFKLSLMKKMALFICTFVLCTPIFSQNVLQDPVTGKVFNSERYSAVNGSPFLIDEWISGSVITPRGVYKNLELKLDAYGNTLFFKNDGKPFEFQDKVIGFTLMKRPGDSSTYLNFKNGLSGNGVRTDQYLQVLAEGKLSLYRSDIKLLTEVNQVNQGVIKTFTTSTRYYLMKDNVLQLIRMNKKDIYDLVQDKESQIETFVSQNKLSTKKETDLVKIVQYYNSL
jgi:hypothetical protein